MASSHNLAAIDPWMCRSTGDSWFSDDFARETESALTKALQQSLFSNPLQSEVNHPISSTFLVNRSDYCTTTTTPSASTVTGGGSGSGSGSDPETPGSKRRGGSIGVAIGKTTKRKSRASKRSMTTFIQADPSNFRQMVQQVTGVKLEGNGKLPVVKPEPIRQPFVVNRLQGLLPTLDTSAYLLDVQNGNAQHRTPASGSTVSANGFSQLPAIGPVTENGGGGVDFYSLCSFPTLESSI